MERNLLPVTIVFLFIATYFVNLLTAQNTYQNKKDFRETILESNVALDQWDPPQHVKKLFPYYFAGYDYEDRPVWFFEFGKYDLRSYFETGGEEAVKLYDNYTDQFYYRVANSPKQRAKNPQQPGDTFAFICDMEGYDLRQLSSPQAVQHTLKLARDLNIAGENMAYFFLINTNFFGQSIINIIKPALGGVFGRLEVFGTNKEKWLPKMLKNIPKESLAEWYGGYKNYTPIAIYG